MNRLSTFSRVLGISLCTAVLACLISQPASASPPSPREVARRVHNRVSGFFFRVARVLEGEPQDRKERERARRQYEEEVYYEDEYEPEPETGLRRPHYGPDDDYIAPPPPMEREREPRRQTRPSDEDPRYYGSGSSREAPQRQADKPAPQNTTAPRLELKNKTEGEPRREEVDRQKSSDAQARRDGTNAAAAGDKKIPYATPVPNKNGFVYPPGSKQQPENMLDVRGLEPGQKARDPRTGDVFLVP